MSLCWGCGLGSGSEVSGDNRRLQPQIIATGQGHLGASHSVLSVGGHGHANYMQMTCKPTQDLPGVSGAVEGAEESEARSPGGWWGYPGFYPTVQTDPAQPQGSRFGVGMGIPEHQPWFCCWLRKSRTWPQDSGKKAGTHRAARQSKAHAEREGICPGSHNQAEAERTRIQAF